MRFKIASVLIACGLSFSAIPASAEMIDVNVAQSVHTRIMRGAPDRCGMSGPVIIHLGDAQNQRQVRCATPVTYQNNISAQVNNFVVVFLADGHKRHYKRFH